MLKLYKPDSNPKEYWETWELGESHIIHWGELGTRGQSEKVRSGLLSKATSKIQKMADERVAQGFLSVEPENHHILMIEHAVDGFGSQADLDKRHRLKDRMTRRSVGQGWGPVTEGV